MAHGVYAARAALVPEGVAGRMREAEEADRALLLEWILAFQDEALPEDAPHIDLERALDRRLASETDGFALWEVDEEPVSLCGYGGPTPRGIRIAPVYTPPGLRRHGYASALTAHVTKRLLDGGRTFCFLYTDLANPTSNKIYMDVGYELVCEAADYVFD
jgi:predicted GNAT family acetyltransferase